MSLSNTNCMYYGDWFVDLVDAKNNCSKDTKCGSVLDRGCDEHGPFNLCSFQTIRDTSDNFSCVYNKKGSKFFRNQISCEIYLHLFKLYKRCIKFN